MYIYNNLLFHRTCNNQRQLNQVLQQESLEIQQKAIISSPQFEEKLKSEESNENLANTDIS